MLCTPGIGPTPEARFITGYCHTLGPGGRPTLIPHRWKFVHRFIEGYRSWKDILREKSRQMLVSHLSCDCALHSLMFRHGYSGVFGSADAGLVDDGGENSTSDSLFGRIRYTYEHLPPWLRDYAPVVFTKNRIVCSVRESYLVGDSRKGNIGRGGTYTEGLIDEAAYIELGEASLAALEPAVERLCLQSTPNGRKNMFARTRHDRDSGFVIETYPWWDHPMRRQGIYKDPDDGRLRSPWYDKRTAKLSDERRAREYDLDYTTSTSGLVFKEFRVSRPPAGHVVPRAELRFNPRLETGIGIDFGHARKTAAVILQKNGAMIHVVADFEGKHRAATPNAKDLLRLVRSLGFTQPLDTLELLPDPAGQWDEPGGGDSILSYYQNVGFSNWRFPMISGPRSVALGIALVREKLIAGEILVSDACTHLIDRIQDYRYPTDPRTDEIRSNNPVHDMASHIMDALRYAVTSWYTADGEEGEDEFTEVDMVEAAVREHTRTDRASRVSTDGDPDGMPVGPGVRPMLGRHPMRHADA